MLKSLESYIGILLVHTPKALKREPYGAIGGCSPTRVYAVVEVQGKYLIAWKCEKCPNGKIYHPMHGELPATSKKLFCRGKLPHGPKPTALVRPDSYVKEYHA